MNNTMLRLLLSISGISAFMIQNASQAGFTTSNKAETNMVMSQMQNKANSDAMMLGRGDECGARDNRIVEGVSMVQNDPMSEQLREAERRQRCVATKIKAQQDFNRRVSKLIQETANDTKKDFQQNLDKKKCVNKLDRANHECFVKNVLNDFYTSVVWKVAVHDNVAQLWYHDKLVLMIVFETVEYNIKPEEQECFTFFPTSNVAAEENALGHVVNIIGKPATPKTTSEGECRPCSDFAKDGKTQDGAGMKCSNSCDPATVLFSASNFKTKKKNANSAKSEASASKAKDE